MYSANYDLAITVDHVEIEAKTSDEGNYYTFAADIKYNTDSENTFSLEGTALFVDGKIKYLYFDTGLINAIEKEMGGR